MPVIKATAVQYCTLQCPDLDIQEQFLIQESLAGDLEKTIVRVDEMMHNGVNIQRMMKDIDRLRDDVEMLKDKVRKNGKYSSGSINVGE